MGRNDFFRVEFDYEEDDHDRFDEYNRSNGKDKVYTNKSTLKRLEFDYEEDPYEPEKVDKINLSGYIKLFIILFTNSRTCVIMKKKS